MGQQQSQGVWRAVHANDPDHFLTTEFQCPDGAGEQWRGGETTADSTVALVNACIANTETSEAAAAQLLAAGADPNQPCGVVNHPGMSPFARLGVAKTTRTCSDFRALEACCWHGSAPLVRLLLHHGADARCTSSIGIRIAAKMPQLHVALWQYIKDGNPGHAEVARELMRGGADVNDLYALRPFRRATALHFALHLAGMFGNDEAKARAAPIIRDLLIHGHADPNQTSAQVEARGASEHMSAAFASNHWPAVHWAAHHGALEACVLLCTFGAAPGVQVREHQGGDDFGVAGDAAALAAAADVRAFLEAVRGWAPLRIALRHAPLADAKAALKLGRLDPDACAGQVHETLESTPSPRRRFARAALAGWRFVLPPTLNCAGARRARCFWRSGGVVKERARARGNKWVREADTHTDTERDRDRDSERSLPAFGVADV